MKLKTALVILTISMLPGLSWADDKADSPMKWHRHHRHGDCVSLLDKVGLSPEQKQKVETIHQHERDQLHPLFETVIQKKRALSQYLSSPQANADDAYNRQSEITDLRDRIGKAHIDAMLKIKDVLTPEQQQKFAAVEREEAQKCADMHAHGVKRHHDDEDEQHPAP